MPDVEPKGRWWTRNPLRVKLVAATLALVAFALVVISVSSAYALNNHLLARADSQLTAVARTINIAALYQTPTVLLPTDYVAGVPDGNGGWVPRYYDSDHFSSADLPAVSTNAEALSEHLGQPYTVRAVDGRYRWRILITQLPSNQVIIIGQNLYNQDSALDRLIFVEVLVGTSVLVALALVGVWLVRMSLRPLAAMERTAAAIAGGDLTQRVPELDPRTELGQLSAALNTMLNQVEAAFQERARSQERAVRSEERMRQFVADASHELRTPLTTIRGFAELYRQGAAPDPAEVLRRIEDEAARMGLLVEDLLLLARLDRERPLQLSRVHLADLVNDAAAAARAVAPDRDITVVLAEPVDRLVVDGDEGRLRQVIGNLVTNALTHTPPATPVTLRLAGDGAQYAVVDVIDRGPGLTAEQAERVFERFYRVDKARTRRAASPSIPAGGPTVAHSGTGLGLAIVSALVVAHAGTVQVISEPGQGATFRVRLPLAGQ
ncbi:MAG TPA: HAMP domain-containing sensor histidine kinase [Micromonosporaceae bacterium]